MLVKVRGMRARPVREYNAFLYSVKLKSLASDTNRVSVGQEKAWHSC